MEEDGYVLLLAITVSDIHRGLEIGRKRRSGK
jgi:hypothetical protein